MGGVSIYELVLAPVCLIGYDDDVPAVGQKRVAVLAGLRKELLDGGEYHPADIYGEFLPEVAPALGLGWVLAEEFAATGECAEELVVQIVPVGEDDDGRVVHVGVAC